MELLKEILDSGYFSPPSRMKIKLSDSDYIDTSLLELDTMEMGTSPLPGDVMANLLINYPWIKELLLKNVCGDELVLTTTRDFETLMLVGDVPRRMCAGPSAFVLHMFNVNNVTLFDLSGSTISELRVLNAEELVTVTGLQHSSDLTFILFERCPRLKTLPELSVSTALIGLSITDCPEIEFCPVSFLMRDFKYPLSSQLGKLPFKEFYWSKRGFFFDSRTILRKLLIFVLAGRKRRRIKKTTFIPPELVYMVAEFMFNVRNLA